jgi:hypothetical protein
VKKGKKFTQYITIVIKPKILKYSYILQMNYDLSLRTQRWNERTKTK